MDSQECLIGRFLKGCYKHIDVILKQFITIASFSDFASYAYTTNDIVYEWNQVGVQLARTASGALPNFEIVAVKNSSCDSTTNT